MIENYVQKWQSIPHNAFLYFPKGQLIKSGQAETQWRKIFQSGSPYDDYENKMLLQLQKYLKQNNIEISQWFDTPNRLRYLQANKFNIKKTVESLKQYTKWRRQSYPIKITSQHMRLIKSGSIYLCGRDMFFRPIIVIDMNKFDPKDQKIIPEVLVTLLIEGQVENYILIIDLESVSMSLRSCVTEIMSFTSNSYRGRLFASYFLSTPRFINWGWETFASAFVSENTLKKIQISKTLTHESMWTHINKDAIEVKYGGTMPNLIEFDWPPNSSLLNKNTVPENCLIDKKEYNKLYNSGQLKNRKICSDLLIVQIEEPKILRSPIKPEVGKSIWESIRHLHIMKQTSYQMNVKTLTTFFSNQKYIKISSRVH